MSSGKLFCGQVIAGGYGQVDSLTHSFSLTANHRSDTAETDDSTPVLLTDLYRLYDLLDAEYLVFEQLTALIRE